MNSRIIILAFSLFTSISLSQNKNEIDSLVANIAQIEVDSLRIQGYEKLFLKNYINNPETALRLLDSLKSVANRVNTQTYKALIAELEGKYLQSRSKYPEAESKFMEAISLYRAENNLKKALYIPKFLSDIQVALGKYENATNLILENIKEKEAAGFEKHELAGDYSSLGILHGTIGKMDVSFSYFEEAEKIYEEEGMIKKLAQVRLNLGVVSEKSKKYERALEYYNKSLKEYLKLNDKKNLCLLHGNIGVVNFRMGDDNQSEINHKKSLEIAEEIKYNKMIATASNNLGELYRSQKKYKDAIRYSEKSLKVNTKIQSKKNLVSNYKNLSLIHKESGNYKEALNYKTLQMELNDSILNEKVLARVNKLQIDYETEKKEAALALQEEEIKTLNVQAKNDKLTKTLYGIGMFSLIAIAGLLYFGFKQRIKKNKIAREKQEAIYMQEIEFKKKELASQTLHLVQKNTFIQELKENLEKIKRSPELFKVEFRRLVTLLKRQSSEDKDWEVFKSYFSQVHNDFDNKIKSLASDITENEIRLASFIRMNLSTKEIASIQNVLPKSVLTGKYRLKKKLELDKETDLYGYLMNL